MPKFSVIIATYNRAKYITATLESLKAQEFKDFEAIVVDDGSTDNTLELLKPHRSWLKVFQEQNGGPGRARNVGIGHATGEYIAFLDSDDIWFPWTLSTFADVAEQHSNPDLIATRLKLFWRDRELAMVEREPLRVEAFPDYYASSHKRYFVGAGMMVVRRGVFHNAGGFTERRIYAEDADLALRFGVVDRFAQILSPVTLGYRQHETNACKNWNMIAKGTMNLVAKERAGKYPGGSARKCDRLRLVTLHTRPFSVAYLKNGHQKRGWVLYWATASWHVRIFRWKYLFGFPVVSLLCACGLWRPQARMVLANPRLSTAQSRRIMNDLKEFLRSHRILRSLARLALEQSYRALTLWARITRNVMIHRYARCHSPKALQIGCGPNLLPGWLNTDVFVCSPRVVFVDATKPIPLDSETFDYIFSEHVIEHLSYEEGLALLRECFRILKPGGVLRIATPNISMLASLFSNNAGPESHDYVKWFVDRNLPGLRKYRAPFVLNHFVYSWGYRFIYDRQTLAESFCEAGFTNLEWCPVGESSHSFLCDLERHGTIVGNDRWNDFETIVLEGRRI
jgi:glycosyltransferase involved in cell wall biosynthesis/predicted SAM-dependent methyltransferase